MRFALFFFFFLHMKACKTKFTLHGFYFSSMIKFSVNNFRTAGLEENMDGHHVMLQGWTSA